MLSGTIYFLFKGPKWYTGSDAGSVILTLRTGTRLRSLAAENRHHPCKRSRVFNWLRAL